MYEFNPSRIFIWKVTHFLYKFFLTISRICMYVLKQIVMFTIKNKDIFEKIRLKNEEELDF